MVDLSFIAASFYMTNQHFQKIFGALKYFRWYQIKYFLRDSINAFVKEVPII